MAKKKTRQIELICPECKGAGFNSINCTCKWNCSDFRTETCFYCFGTGIATDDDSFEPLYHYEDDWRG